MKEADIFKNYETISRYFSTRKISPFSLKSTGEDMDYIKNIQVGDDVWCEIIFFAVLIWAIVSVVQYGTKAQFPVWLLGTIFICVFVEIPRKWYLHEIQQRSR